MLDPRDLDRMAKQSRLRAAKQPQSAAAHRVARDCPCVSCGYNLKGMAFGGVCPECASPVQRSIVPEDPDARPWVDASRWRPQWWIDTFGPPAQPASSATPKPVASSKSQPPHCAVCSYDCKGLPRGRPCPECGTPRPVIRRAGAIEAGEAVQAFARHGWSGAALTLGWAGIGLGCIMLWASYLGDGFVGGLFWNILSLAGFAANVAGGGAVCWGIYHLLIGDPPEPVRRHSYLLTRALAVGAAGFWCWMSLTGLRSAFDALRSIVGGVAVVGHLDSDTLIALCWAALPVCFYCRAMYPVASLVGQGERSLRAGFLGVPIVALFILGSIAVLQVVSLRGEAIVLISAASLGAVLAPAAFIPGNIRMGQAVWWAPRNQHQALTREQRKLAQWEERARADREKERLHGTSAGL